MALIAKKLCLIRYRGKNGSLEAFLACKLIPLDKNPGVRPIGIGEVIRRILGRAVMTTFRRNVLESSGDLQLCAGQRAGCEAAVHALSSIFSDDNCDAILLIDADNAFNRINRKVMLHNIRIICPIIATYVINSYHQQARLFISGGSEITSAEGTTQGDPTAMPIYALGSIPLLDATVTDNTKHAAYADDISCAGKLTSILAWWKKLNIFGPKVGYFPKAKKSWLIVKPEKYETAKDVFKTTKLNITKEGKRHLGAVVGTEEYKIEYVNTKVNEWVKELKFLSKIATFYPQAAYCAFTSGYRQKFNYIIRTIPNISHLLQPVENIIRQEFIPSLFEGRSCTDEERKLLSLPVKLGGLGIINLTSISDIEYETSKRTTKDLVDKIKHQRNTSSINQHTQNGNQQETANSSKKFYDNLLEKLRSTMTPMQLKANDIATSDGASIWLSSLPLKDEKFSLTKREFFDAVALRYGFELKRLPHECVCKAKYNIDHALTCKTGGFVTLRHNELVDVTADLLSMVCKDVKKEPTLSTAPNNDEELRADISVRSFWQRLQRAFVDVRVFYPFAPSYRNQSLSTTMKAMEKQKKRKYNQRILDGENGSFTPLVFTTNGGMSTETKQFYRRLSQLLCEKSDVSYSETSAWVKRQISFSLLRTSVICIRGSRSRKNNIPVEEKMDIDVTNRIVDIH